ncbi:hypothetical protein VTG60DRAFT_5884 [Thermothelomyces hinnuleus]
MRDSRLFLTSPSFCLMTEPTFSRFARWGRERWVAIDFPKIDLRWSRVAAGRLASNTRAIETAIETDPSTQDTLIVTVLRYKYHVYLVTEGASVVLTELRNWDSVTMSGNCSRRGMQRQASQPSDPSRDLPPKHDMVCVICRRAEVRLPRAP